MLAYYTKLHFLDHEIGLKLRTNALSGINYLMVLDRNVSPFNEAQQIDLFGDGTDSVTLTRKPWGIFELAVSNATQGKRKFSRAAMLAYKMNEQGESALYIPDNNAPVYLAGNTLLKGTVYASSRKFSSGYVDGKEYKRDRFVYGDIKKSETAIPDLDTVLLREIKDVLELRKNSYALVSADRLPANVSFSESGTQYYRTNQSIDLEDSIRGNLIIQSAIKIRVTAHARLSDIILIAPDIDIDKGFEGNIQCFAERSITVGAESFLRYPSALVLIGGEKDSTIVIGRDATVQGYVVIQGYDKTIGSRGTFKVEDKGVLQGMAYINGSSDIQGALRGHLTTRSTQAKLQSAVYGNHIFNGEINALKRSAFLPASGLWGNSKEMVVAKWLD